MPRTRAASWGAWKPVEFSASTQSTLEARLALEAERLCELLVRGAVFFRRRSIGSRSRAHPLSLIPYGHKLPQVY